MKICEMNGVKRPFFSSWFERLREKKKEKKEKRKKKVKYMKV